MRLIAVVYLTDPFASPSLNCEINFIEDTTYRGCSWIRKIRVY